MGKLTKKEQIRRATLHEKWACQTITAKELDEVRALDRRIGAASPSKH